MPACFNKTLLQLTPGLPYLRVNNNNNNLFVSPRRSPPQPFLAHNLEMTQCCVERLAPWLLVRGMFVACALREQWLVNDAGHDAGQWKAPPLRPRGVFNIHKAHELLRGGPGAAPRVDSSGMTIWTRALGSGDLGHRLPPGLVRTSECFSFLSRQSMQCRP